MSINNISANHDCRNLVYIIITLDPQLNRVDIFVHDNLAMKTEGSNPYGDYTIYRNLEAQFAKIDRLLKLLP